MGFNFYSQRNHFLFISYLHGEVPFQLSIGRRCRWCEGFSIFEQAVEKIFYTHRTISIKIMEDFLKHLEKNNHLFSVFPSK